jgi:hypothetical protein
VRLTTIENGTTAKPKVSAADRARVRFLASTLYDWAAHVKTSTGMIVARGSAPGEVASAYRSCPACSGLGVKRDRGFPIRCERCGGKGELAIDGYTRREVEAEDPDAPLDLQRHFNEIKEKGPEGLAGTIRDQHRHKVDALISAGEAAELDSEDDAFTGACSAKERQWQRGSYAELERVWFAMREREPRRFRDFGRFLVYGLEIRTARMEGRVERLVVLVAHRMAKPILPAHVPGMKTVRERRPELTATGERNAEIRRLYGEEGWKQSRLAWEFGISQPAVSKIVGKERAA